MTLVVAGTGGDSGKTLVSLGLAAAWRAGGVDVQAFKKGPDYIDAAWLSCAAGRPARNLDAWMQGSEAVRASFGRHASEGDAALIEGNRGLFDGFEGTSTAALAHLLGAKVVLVLDVTKTTRTPAAIVAGCRVLDPELDLAGVVLNRVSSARHEAEARDAIRTHTDVEVLGALPRLRDPELLPDRHLGLVPPTEHRRMAQVVERLGELAGDHLDVDRLRALARPGSIEAVPSGPSKTRKVARIGWFSDAAFTFYYPENLEALEAAGAELVAISALEDEALPEIDLLYLGGGFPETHAPVLAESRSMLESVRNAADGGLPVYAECGGLIYLARSVLWRGRRHELAGVLDLDIDVRPRPQGHGYVRARVDRPNPFFPEGTELRGHEFHYGRVVSPSDVPALALDVRRGAGSVGGRDGWTRCHVFASWIHLHALGTPAWAPALVRAAAARATDRIPLGGC